MRVVLLLLAPFAAALLLGCAAAAPAPAAPAAPAGAAGRLAVDMDTAAVRLPALRDELLAMAQADQEVRAAANTLFRPGEPPDPAEMARFAARMDSVDAANLARLREIVHEHGWPDRGMVGGEAASAVFLLVQHADRDVTFQREYLAWLERAHHAGELGEGAGAAVALLTDRVRVNEGRPQLYGTQARIGEGRMILHPIEEEERVDARRAALGLPPLAEYLEQLKRFYGIPD